MASGQRADVHALGCEARHSHEDPRALGPPFVRDWSRLQNLGGRSVDEVPFDQLAQADLHIDAQYRGGRPGNAGDDPLPRLLRVDCQGGFRKRGRSGNSTMVLGFFLK